MLTQRTITNLLFVAGIALTSLGCPQVRVTAPNLDADQDTALALRKALEAGAEASSGAAATRVEPTGWATLKGRFQLNGSAPQLSPLKVDKDTAVCAPGGMQIMAESPVVVGPSGGIQNILIYLLTETDAPNWEHPSYQESQTGTVIFDQKNCIFLSHVIAMRSTQTLRILNSDPILHNTNIQAGRGASAFNGSVSGNGETTYQPGGQTDRPFPISCGVHPWMSAHMITRDNPYFAVSDADGNFEMPNLPAGTGVELEFRVWQESTGFLQKVSVNGETTSWKQGKFKVSLTPDEQRELNVTVDSSLFNN